jgi:predicted DNA-binding transcriptional regulator AlpA
VVARGGEIIHPDLRHPPNPGFFAIVVSGSPPLPGGSSQDHGGSIMSDSPAGLPPRFLRTPEAARFLGLSGRTLEKHRTYGTGPKYRKIGGRIIYALDDLRAWADLGVKQSTSDPGVGTVLPAKRVNTVARAYGNLPRR